MSKAPAPLVTATGVTVTAAENPVLAALSGVVAVEANTEVAVEASLIVGTEVTFADTELTGENDNGVVTVLKDVFGVEVATLIFSLLVPFSSSFVTSVIVSELVASTGLLAKLNELKALFFWTVTWDVGTVGFSAKSEPDNMEPKFSEFIILLVFGYDLPKMDAVSNTDGAVDVVTGAEILDTTVYVADTEVPLETVAVPAVVVTVCVGAKVAKDPEVVATAGGVLKKDTSEVAELDTTTLGVMPNGVWEGLLTELGTVSNVASNGLPEKIELVDAAVGSDGTAVSVSVFGSANENAVLGTGVLSIAVEIAELVAFENNELLLKPENREPCVLVVPGTDFVLSVEPIPENIV